MAAAGEHRKHNDSGFIGGPYEQCADQDAPLERSTSSEADLYTSEPVSEQESVSQSIAVSKDGPIGANGNAKCNTCCQSESEITINKQIITQEEHPRQVSQEEYQQAVKAHGEQQLEKTLQQHQRLLWEGEMQYKIREQEIKLQELEHKERLREKERQSEVEEMEMDQHIKKLQKMLELKRLKEQLQQGPATLREVNTDIEPGPSPSIGGSAQSISAMLEDSETEVHAQETKELKDQHDEFESEQKCSPVEEATMHHDLKDAIVTGLEEVHAKQQTDINEDSNLHVEHNFTPDFDGAGVLIALPEIPRMVSLHKITKTWQHNSKTGYWSHTDEAMLLEETCEIAPHAKYTLYPTTNACITAAAIRQLTDEWLQRTDTTLHSFIICIPSGWKYNETLEAAINRAQAAGIAIVCAASIGHQGEMVYPAALGSVLCIGAVNPEGSLAPYSASGGAVDYVESGVIVRRHKNGPICGTSVSAARFTGHLAQIFQLIFTATGDCVNFTTTCILKEFLLFGTSREYTSGMGYGRADFKSLMKRPAMQIKQDLEHIMFRRNRRQYHADPSRGDAKANTEHWSWCRNLNPNPSLSGAGISLAVIDDISESYLDHVNKHHGIEIKREMLIQYFYIRAKDLMQECCKPYYKGTQGHVLQCGAIVAKVSPNCRLLLIKHHKDDPGEKGALEVVKRERPHILLVSAVTTDTPDLFSTNLAPILSWCIVLCAAGNDGKTDRNTICYPARTGNLIVIGACDQLGNRCPYSSVGPNLSLLCPGQFDIADEMGRGGTCYAASAGGAVIAQLCQLISNTCGRVRIHIEGRKETIPTLACNTYLMRSLLCDPSMGLCSRAEHSPTEGHGMLQIDKLSTLTPEMLVQYIRSFYT